MTRRRAWALAAVLAAGAAPATADGAAPVSIAVPASPDAIAVASGRVLWAVHSRTGPIVVSQAPATGGPPRVVATIARAWSGDVSVSLAANESGFVVAVRERRAEHVHGSFGGVPRTLVDCVTDVAVADQPALAAVAGRTGFAFAGARCGAAAVELVGADGSRSPVPDLRVYADYGLAYSEPYLAVTAGIAPPAQYVRVIDLATGAERHLPPAYAGRGSALALSADGTLVVGPGTHDFGPPAVPPGIYAWPPGPASRPALLTANADAATLRVAAGRVLFDGGSGLGLVGVGGGRVALVGAPGAGAAGGPLGFDGRTAAFASVSCQGAAQITVVDVSRPLAPPSADGCPVKLVREAIRFGPNGGATLGVVCRNGCRGTLALVRISSPGQRCDDRPAGERVVRPGCPTVATARLRLSASSELRRISARLTHDARLARRFEVQTALGGGDGLELIGTPTRTVVLSGRGE